MNIGTSVIIKGNITASEDFDIAGRVEGNIRLQAGVLTLAPGSQVVGDISAPVVVVQGSVNGNVTATERLDVRPGAAVMGSLSTARLVVADGAQMKCRVEMPALARPHLVQGADPARMPVAV